MRNTISLCLLMTLVATFSTIRETRATATTPTESLAPLMLQNLDSVLKLQEFASNKEAFFDQKNHQTILTLIQNLRRVSEHLPTAVLQNKKPGLNAISDIFGDYIYGLESSFKSGHKIYARQQVHTISRTCFSCHSTEASSSLKKNLDQQIQKLHLDPLEQGDLLVATRQFDKALNAYQQILNKKEPLDPYLHEWTQALKRALSVSVRVKQDPQLTLDIIKRAKDRSDLPLFLKGTLDQWTIDAQAWKTTAPNLKNKSAQDLIQIAHQLIHNSKTEQKYTTEHLTDIRFMRATAYLHQAMSQTLTTDEQAQAYYLLGLSNSTLMDPLMWNLDEYYFQTCIQKKPHSELAQSCYRELANEVYFGFTGSSGTSLPKEESDRLKKLRRLAE